MLKMCQSFGYWVIILVYLEVYKYAMICDVCIVHNMFDIEMLDYVICV